MNRWLLTFGDFASTLGRVVELQRLTDGEWSARCLAEFLPSPSRQVPGKGLTGARLAGHRLWVCHFNGIVQYDLVQDCWDTWLERDDFNDLHDLDLEFDSSGEVSRVVVANTGRDSIFTFDPFGELLTATHLEPAPGALRSKEDDAYFGRNRQGSPWQQKLVDRVHPNAVRFSDDGVLVSRFLDRRVERLMRTGQDVCRLDGLPHDLVVVGDEVWCTTTDGRVWAFLPGGEEPARLVVDTFRTSGASGWCRGLAVDDRWLVVGLTRITSMPCERWCDRPLEQTRTMVLIYDRTTLKCAGRVDLASFGAEPKLFSIVSYP